LTVGQMHHFQMFDFTKYSDLETQLNDHSGSSEITHLIDHIWHSVNG